MSNHSKLFPYLLICLSALVVYLPSFTGEFILDDHPLIENNPYIKEWHSLGSYLSQEDGIDSNSGNAHTGYYRPLLNLSYTLDYKIWGISGPGFRVTNLILHLLTCFMLFIFYGQILGRRDISLWLALVFSLHPVVTETVSWVASRNNILVTLFGLLSLHYYIKAVRTQKFLFYILSLLFFGFSVFSKEFGLMLLPIFFIYQRTLNPQKGEITKELRDYVPFILIAILYFIFRQEVIGTFLSPKGLPDVFARVYNFPYILMLNLKLIYLPYNLHSFIVNIPNKFFNIGTVGGIIFLFTVAYLLFKYRKNSLLLFSSLTFLIAIFPASGIIPTSAPSVISMRWLYFPAVFILIILSQPIEKLIKSNFRIAFYVMGCILLYLGVNSYILNKHLWHSQEVFFKQEVLHFENKYASDGLAQICFTKGEVALAEKYFVESFIRRVERDINYIEYAAIMVEKGKAEEALSYLEKAEACATTKLSFGMISNIRGESYLKLQDLNRASKAFEKAVVFAPREPLFWENLGITQGEMGNHAKAVDYLKTAIRHQSKSSSIYNNLALSYLLSNNCQKAVSLLDRRGFRENNKAKELIKRAKICLGDNS
jgi:protein O-mannosyl-transferase